MTGFNQGFFFYFRDEKGGRKKKGEKHQCVVAFCAPPTGELASNPGVCPDQNRTSDLVLRPALNPLSHTSQGDQGPFKGKDGGLEVRGPW